MNGKDCKYFSWEPQTGDARIVERGEPGGEAGGHVLVQRGHDDDGEWGVEEVVAPDKDCIKDTLQYREDDVSEC